ncbi:MAG: NADH-quinone oxidoreductase subunit C [Eubacterium sp.]|nr:NADH-quinone oxidoreductase subunit C [Eubacterium sp.]
MADTGCELIQISTGELLIKVMEFKKDQYRLMQAHAVSIENGYELSYTFGKDYEWISLRLVVDEKEEIPSITYVYPAAFLYENEMAELFGVKIKMIEVDYQDKLYRIDNQTPMKKL